jgi:hypothetical protein
MPTTYDSVSGAPVYNFPTETKEDFDAINGSDQDKIVAMQLRKLEDLVANMEAHIGGRSPDDPLRQITVAMRELADKMIAVVTPNSVPEANTD